MRASGGLESVIDRATTHVAAWRRQRIRRSASKRPHFREALSRAGGYQVPTTAGGTDRIPRRDPMPR